jgi:REP element-mobilizing transposase RayT
MAEAPLYRNRYRIPSARLAGHDYGDGWYFVTICTKDKIPFFGHIADGQMYHSAIGQAARDCWCAIPEHHPHVELDEWTVMPNHVHGILVINPQSPPPVETRPGASPDGSGAAGLDAPSLDAPGRVSTGGVHGALGNQFGGLKSGSLSAVVNLYKGCVTRWCRTHGYGHFDWQPRFHDSIIHSEAALNAIRAYIRDNPANWRDDVEYRP